MFEKQAPEVEQQEGAMGGQLYTHPAFGTISIVKGNASAGGMELFGSDLNHRKVITVTLNTAHLNRHLNRDWIHSDTQVCSFHMSESQWASMVSSHNGEAVPITFDCRAPEGSVLERMPGIASTETMTEEFDREIRERCEGYVATATELLERLKAAVEDGKANKSTLKELLGLASNLSVGMPNSMAFMHKQMAGAMEKMVTSGKIELEAYVNDMALRTGIEALRNQSPAQIIEQPKSGKNTIDNQPE
ncbi:hypothetical protein GHO41_11770 [Pseudomonas sp. FSL R10-0399]|uniref:hypothetical protein n=1 Tax=Pseudomonas sp. FSL R10-0399 TaxID=2662194 RepID=UPI0012948E1D|nr:hypothetical protein [Pseudomonas sp. FSL R10-0399]MQT58020.1 hypothetical protein [Pseudomonas sp. FSL R10-0399]